MHLAVAERFSEYVGVLHDSLCYHLDSTSRWNQAIDVAKLALRFLETVEDPHNHVQGLRLDLASLNGRRGNFQRSIDYSMDVLATARSTGDVRFQRKSLNNLGLAYSALGRHQEAVEFLYSALDVCSRMDGRNGERLVLDSLATVHLKLGEHDLAEACLLNALRVNRGIDDLYSAGINLAGLGAIYSELAKWGKAREVLEEALVLSRTTGDRYNQATILSRLGDVLEGSADHAIAHSYRRQALEVFEELDAPEAHALRARLVATADQA
jgi:tetratricopeptide (TPR) repeat protein